MLSFIRRPADEHYIDNGSVSCPQRRGRDIEVDRCASCERMTEIDLQAEPPFVRCRPAPARPVS